jgi:hypothetical protein
MGGRGENTGTVFSTNYMLQFNNNNNHNEFHLKCAELIEHNQLHNHDLYECSKHTENPATTK